jgi:hypothetical protein
VSIDQFAILTPECPSYKGILWRRSIVAALPLKAQLPNPKHQGITKLQSPSSHSRGGNFEIDD